MRMPIRIIGFCVVFAATMAVANAQTNVTNNNDGTTGQVPVMSGVSTITNSPITVSGSYVGVGTTSPNANLEVYGSVGMLIDSNNGASFIQFLGSGTPLGYIGRANYAVAGADSNGLGVSSITSLAFGTGSATTERMRITAAGDVGIGTTNPGSKFTVQSDATQGGGPQMLIQGATNTNQQFYLGYDTTADAGFIQALTQGVRYDPLILEGGGGYVGIGTTTPAVKLDVVGNEQVSGTLALPALGASTSPICTSAGGILTNSGCEASSATTLTGTSLSSTVTSSSLTSVGTLSSLNVSGNVGIGTTSPLAKLDVVGSVRSDTGGGNSFMSVGNDPSTNITSGTNTALYLQNTSVTPGNHSLIQAWDANNNPQGSIGFIYGSHTGAFQASIFIEPRVAATPTAFVVASTGNVGIGTATPGTDLAALASPPAAITPILEVNGDIALAQASGGQVIFSDGTVQSTAWNGTTLGGDYAESVDVIGDRQKYEPGDVLVMDKDKPGSFLKSDAAYSKLVTGIYSTKPGLTGRRQSAPQTPDAVPMAMMGIVPAKVTTENGPIEVGDLLVTSSKPGYAMKGTDPARLTGAVVGKALASLNIGTGVIEVVVSLQ